MSEGDPDSKAAVYTAQSNRPEAVDQSDIVEERYRLAEKVPQHPSLVHHRQYSTSRHLNRICFSSNYSKIS